MTIFDSAYATTACKGFVLDKIIEGVERASVVGGLKPNDDCYFSLERGDSVPGFYHPLIVKGPNKESIVVSDFRPFVRFNQNDEPVVSNTYDLDILKNRSALSIIWLDKRPEVLRDVGPLAVATYCSWISENISRRFALSPREQLTVGILAGVFYNCLFSNHTEWVEIEKNRIAVNVSKSTRCSVDDVFEVMDKLETPISDIKDFCARCVDVVGSVRIKDLNAGLLFGILKGSWFGTNAPEMVCVAIEHPPTWLALCQAAAVERTFKKSGIAQIIERSRAEHVKMFTQAFYNLLRHI